MDKTRYKKGLELFKIVDGKAGEKAVNDLKEIVPEIEQYLVEFPFAEIYSRKGLDLRTRELISVAALTTLGSCEPQLKVHIHAALNLGCTRQQIIEVILQMILYTGYPKAINALYTARDVFKKRDKKASHKYI